MAWRLMRGEVLEKVGVLTEEAWKARVEDEAVLGSCLIAVVRANGRRSTNAMVGRCWCSSRGWVALGDDMKTWNVKEAPMRSTLISVVT